MLFGKRPEPNCRICSFDVGFSRLFKFSSAMIVLFILLFFGLSFPFSFTLFSFFIFFGGGTCVTSIFFSVLLLDDILAKTFITSHFLSTDWVSFGSTRMSRQGSKEQNYLDANRFLNQYLLRVTIILTTCFQFLPKEKLLWLSNFVWQRGFLIRDKQILCYSKQH